MFFPWAGGVEMRRAVLVRACRARLAPLGPATGLSWSVFEATHREFTSEVFPTQARLLDTSAESSEADVGLVSKRF